MVKLLCNLRHNLAKHTAATQRDSEERFCIVSLEKCNTYTLFIMYVYEIKVPYFPELEVTIQKLARITWYSNNVLSLGNPNWNTLLPPAQVSAPDWSKITKVTRTIKAYYKLAKVHVHLYTRLFMV